MRIDPRGGRRIAHAKRCFYRLRKSVQAFIPKIDAAIAKAQSEGLKSNGPFACSAFERWAIRNNDAPAKRKFRAWKKSQPAPNLSLDQVRSEFVGWQVELAKRLQEADGLDLQRAKEPVETPQSPEKEREALGWFPCLTQLLWNHPFRLQRIIRFSSR
jgi:hypothetical protein